MPVTQERIIRIVTAGLSFKQAYEKLQTNIRFLDTDLKRTNITKDEMLIAWDTFYYGAIDTIANQVNEAVILITEYEHFRRNKHYNELHAKYMQEKRTANRTGVPLSQIKRDPATHLTQAEQEEVDNEAARQYKEALAKAPKPEDNALFSELAKISRIQHVTRTPFDGQTTTDPVTDPEWPPNTMPTPSKGADK